MLFRWNLDEFIEYRAKFAEARRNNLAVSETLRVLDAVDSKAAALLSHVSIMIAICAFLLNQFNHSTVIGLLILFEGLIYILASLLLLFSVNITKIRRLDNADIIAHQVAQLSITRFNSFKIAHTLTVLSTILLVGTIIFKLLQSAY